MVKKPEQWKWSSYAYNAYGKKDKIITPHKLYLMIHKDKEKIVGYYRASFHQVFDPIVNE